MAHRAKLSALRCPQVIKAAARQRKLGLQLDMMLLSMHRPEDDALQDLAEAIVDGRPVEWDSVGNTGDPEHDAVVRQFHVLATLADIHRRIHSSEDLEATEDLPPTPDTESLESRTTWGPFELKSVLGKGSYGIVYRARDPKLDRDVALKLVPSPDPVTLDKVVAEGRRLARVRHSNVITVYGADVHDGIAGIWMELLEGQTLHHELRERGPLSGEEAALVGIALCQALAAVHRAGLAHRDVKAQNVIRQEGGRIVLTDFGAGRELDAGGNPAGTPLYMAPEVLEGAPASTSSDLYSLGVLLFNLVTGEFPVTGSNLEDLRDAHRTGRRRRLRDVRPDLPSAFVRAVEHATAANPSERPATAAALEAELEGVLRRDAHDRKGSWQVFRWPYGLVAALLIVVALFAWKVPLTDRPSETAGAGIRSIAVMPFESGREDQAYLADGFTRLLIDHLSQLDSLRVIARTSSESYRSQNKAVPVIAAELGVDGIVQGSIDRRGDRIRVRVRVLRADEAPVLDDSFERAGTGVLNVQAEIAERVATAIQASLPNAERRELRQYPGIRPQAQDAFLRALNAMDDLSAPSLERAHRDLLEATRLDPRFALAYATLSRCYYLLGTREVLARNYAHQLALDAAMRAIELDELVADGHTQLAEVKLYYEWDWDVAKREYDRALALNPNGVRAMTRYSSFLSARGEHEAALRWAMQAQGLDPASHEVRIGVGMAHYYAGDFERAIATFEGLTDIPPFTLLAVDRVGLARAYAAVGRYQDAIAQLRIAIKQQGELTPWLAELARTHAAAGEYAEARRLLARVLADPNRSRVNPANIAFVYIELGDIERAFAELDRAVQAKETVMLWAAVDPRFDKIRHDPRFGEILRRIGVSAKTP
jgi:serine/threonine protein kinase/tetratricopeptide (TPR) repeat protein